ncbi:putative quinol monooxygenase [Enterobacter cancerogenus]|uniref:putative quinol monooxygenase n=1 Tax=Enterobacter cancerogenus TaxID=69218 RepID=UPI000537681E|nr:putative quinol monooxygenase [Enterobacter cancerogenus]KGT88709.1 hypothetical protein NH00_19060 [Enterobacter cancerogenus]
MLIVLVKFKVPQEFHAAFKKSVLENARESINERDCHRFDVGETHRDGEMLHEFLLYEEYTDRAAFDFHLSTPHFHLFGKQTEGMVLSKEIQFYQLIK